MINRILNIFNNYYLRLNGYGTGWSLQSSGELKAIQFEMGTPNIYSKVFFKDFYDLLSPNFKVYRISKSKLYPIIEYSPKLEVFLTTNYICFAK